MALDCCVNDCLFGLGPQGDKRYCYYYLIGRVVNCKERDKFGSILPGQSDPLASQEIQTKNDNQGQTPSPTPKNWQQGLADMQARLQRQKEEICLLRQQQVPVGNVPPMKCVLRAIASNSSSYHKLDIFETLSFCFKGHVAPSSTDSGSSGNIIIDFYWGMELYPRIGKNFDIKVFTNCRFGMMSWAVLAVTYCIKQYEVNGKVADSMLVNTILMLVYVTKFFWWEAGYWSTMDIAHDRAGFYICWGCLVWVPSIYTSPGMYLVNHPVHLGTQLALYVLVAGIVFIYINYDCDRQRHEFRRTNGKALVWGKAPSKITATYTTTTGETKSSILLTSGWWGLARHFHYVPEILAAFFWTVPALFNHALPYFYVVFLTILLLDRAKRDDDRCRSKYGKYWKSYCEKVRYRVIPGIY
ncbi:7-dehydrocholesterol reductase-like [Humulus lupulus]|uniref:7-dehydrocholesterol reductase-like n=1 Tax=Humulus lupulus TaxID=3486 RepID=UPI002B401C09|nr:7-dehydrocholesterol reductase-like [Humulus lupulus]